MAALFFALPAQAAFSIETATLRQFEDGPVLPASHVFLPGEPIFFTCRLAGFQPLMDPKDESRTVKITWRLQVTDPDGGSVMPPVTGAISEPLFRQDKEWRPKFLQEFTVPPFAPPGKYRIRAEATDEIAKTSTSTEITFDVRGHTVEPSPELTARNLHFLNQEEDAPPLDPAAYHPGETLWARFDITGYAFEKTVGPPTSTKTSDGKPSDAKTVDKDSAENVDMSRFSVEYGLAILKESGEQVFARPNAAADTANTYYPQRYVPGAVSLTIDPKVPTGNYILLITLEDKVSGKKAEARGGFRIW